MNPQLQGINRIKEGKIQTLFYRIMGSVHDRSVESAKVIYFINLYPKFEKIIISPNLGI